MSDYRFRYNGHDLGDWLRVNPTRSIAPKIDAETVEVPGRPGEVFVRAHMEPLEIPVHMRLRLRSGSGTDDVADKRRMLSAIFTSGAPVQLVLPDEPTRYYLALLTDPDALTALWSAGSCDATFTAFDPIAYGHDRAVELEGETTLVAPGGNYETRPVLELEASGGPLEVHLEETGEFVRLVDEPEAGNRIVVDMSERRATIDGVYAAVDIDSDFFALAPGTNHVRVSGASGGVIEWTERWQ